MRLLIIRHSDPAYPDDRLSERGHREARTLAGRLAAGGLDALHTSPMRRAAETARHVAERTGLTPRVADWTRELEGWWIDDGPQEEWPAWNVDGGRIRDLCPRPESWPGDPPFDRRVIRDEFAALKVSSDLFLADLGYRREGPRYRVEQANRLRVAVVCHAGFALTWLAHLLEIPAPLMWAGFYLPPSSVTTVVMEERSAEWAAPRCLELGDVSHLRAAGLEPHRIGLVANSD